MSLFVSLALVKEYAGLIDKIFVCEESDQGIGFVASSGNCHILSIYRKEKQEKNSVTILRFMFV